MLDLNLAVSQRRHKSRYSDTCHIFVVFLNVLLISACGGNASEKEVSVKTGVFQDSFVAGLSYSTATQGGVTNKAGEFRYLDGEKITFSIGGVTIGRSVGAAIITPLDLVDGADIGDRRVINILRLLQSLDRDGEPDNGIDILDTAREINASRSSLFVQQESDFTPLDEESLHSLVVELLGLKEGDITEDILVSAAKALQHFQDTLNTVRRDAICRADFCLPNSNIPIQVGICESDENNVIGSGGRYLCHKGVERFAIHNQLHLSTNSLHYLAARYPNLYDVRLFAEAAHVSILSFYTSQVDGWEFAEIAVGDGGAVGRLGQYTDNAPLACGLPNGGRSFTVLSPTGQAIDWRAVAYRSEFCLSAMDDEPICDGFVGDRAQVFKWQGIVPETTEGECRLIKVSNQTTSYAKGIVYDNETRAPLAGVQITVFDDSEVESALIEELLNQVVFTDQDGSYEVEVPVDRELTLQFARDGYRSDSMVLNVETGKTLYLENRYLGTAYGHVSGKLIYADGCYAVDQLTTVRLYNGFNVVDDQQESLKTAQAESNGEYLISDIAPGDYTLRFDINAQEQLYPPAYRNVTILSGQTVVSKVVAIPPEISFEEQQVHFLVWTNEHYSRVETDRFDVYYDSEGGECLMRANDINEELSDRPEDCPVLLSFFSDTELNIKLFVANAGLFDREQSEINERMLADSGMFVEGFIGENDYRRIDVPDIDGSIWDVIDVQGEEVSVINNIFKVENFQYQSCEYMSLTEATLNL